MTQKEAVERLVGWLPQEAYMAPLKNPETLKELFWFMKAAYCYMGGAEDEQYHFSQVHCGLFIGRGKRKKLEQIFLQTPCICIKVSKNNHIVWFKEHLPYQGDCR